MTSTNVQPAILQKKGWNDREIAKAERFINVPRPQDTYFSKIVFWSALMVIIFANVIVSLVLIPFLIVFQNVILYSIIILLAGSIGFLYRLLITDIGHLEQKHHIWAGILIPLIAAVNMVVVVLVSNSFIRDVAKTSTPQNPWLIAALFSAALIIPYFLHLLRRR
ncbi:hypothetical protein HY496_00830 [Candidatus Woesearchaeota archaeon]|nr:hypothetical protein [Candidatus Woesearchaeota archaeon]